MTWAAPPTFTDGSVLTGAQLNILRDDLNETAPAKATAAGQIFVSTAANSIAARTPTSAYSGGSDTTTSTSFVDLVGGAGPSVTVTTGAAALVSVGCRLSNNTSTAVSYMGYAVSGATTAAASVDRSFSTTSATSNAAAVGSSFIHETGLTPGSNVFTAKYQVSSGTGSFDRRRLLVIPL